MMIELTKEEADILARLADEQARIFEGGNPGKLMSDEYCSKYCSKADEATIDKDATCTGGGGKCPMIAVCNSGITGYPDFIASLMKHNPEYLRITD
jgi:hypothetical protein